MDGDNEKVFAVFLAMEEAQGKEDEQNGDERVNAQMSDDKVKTFLKEIQTRQKIRFILTLSCCLLGAGLVGMIKDNYEK